MKIHQTIGLVAGVHLLAFLLIFVSPGCSSTNNASAAAPAPGTTPIVAAGPTSAPAPVQDAPAPLVAAPSAGPVFYSPTRPNTAAAEALAPMAPPPEVTPAETYTVRSGDSLWLIAHHHHIKVSVLAAANNLRSGASLRAGQKLIIPQPNGIAAGAGASRAREGSAANAPAGGSTAARAAGPAGTPITYTVKSGDKLSSIARRYGLTTGALAAENNISDPRKIRPGQVLVIPAGGSVHRARKSRAAAPAADTSAPATLQPIAPASSLAPSSEAPSSAPVPIIRIDGGDAGGSSAPSSNG